ncbi:Protein TolB [Planctomycetes bacterium CA13]|uniref:Protein TolB n=1 Tax=Novipirellula herctigrandis TaxID=2527986 RepID=A0A5C5YW40_9BACT|nr:Protein TolB [Planctomycetes bacterium CA13]
MTRKARSPLLVILAALVLPGTWMWFRSENWNIEDAANIDRLPHIRPDFSDAVIPPNIAPLNFVVQEPGTRFLVNIRSKHTTPIRVVSRSPKIEIPPQLWRSLLEANRGEDLHFELYSQVEGRWQQFQSINNRIAPHPIDGHLVYRLTGQIHNFWNEISIFQHDLATNEKLPVIEGKAIEHGCVNCHSFSNNRPNQMCIGMRSSQYGSGAIVVTNGEAKKLGRKLGYTTWHPSGRLAVYSINKVRQFFHTAQSSVRDVIDMDSALEYFDVETEQVSLIQQASDRKRLETYPCWSPDGEHLYYCSAPILWEDSDAVPPERYAEVKYDLMRIHYDLETDTWGEPELVLSAEKTGLSILQPRISPDGKFLLFCMCRYGCFPIYQPTSDLYIMDLETREYMKPDINSSSAEAWHSWSSNSRWIAFSSRRRGGVFTRCYLSFVDESGQAHKPFILPQNDPEAYDSLLKSMSVPELTSAPIPIDAQEMARVARSEDAFGVDAMSEATTLVDMSEPWEPGHR